MPRSLPPLNPLRAFEAAARCGSFTRAAQELCVTQGAVSRHIATLEGWLKVQLFERGRQGIQLTPSGASYFESVRSALDQLDRSTRELRQMPDDRRLRIKLPPTFAIRWLVPRLARFHALHPQIDVQITTSHERVDFARDELDAGIHSEAKPPTGPGFRLLFGELLVPVCAPALLKNGPPLNEPRDLANHVLLCSTHRPSDWPTWLNAAGATTINGNAGLKFENAALAYQAALDQLGITIAVLPFVRDDLASGRLVAPLGLRVPAESSYYLAYAAQSPPQRVRDFEAWVAAEAAREEVLP
ncbi:MAG TPA: transcriptional regulator GcvA [Burkholderiaceae bacterium]